MKPAQFNEQEPNGSLRDTIAVNLLRNGVSTKQRSFVLADHFIRIISIQAALAAQQRPWVDLTEDEMDNVRRSMGYNQFMSAGEYAKLVQFVTQTKLKEKNNG